MISSKMLLANNQNLESDSLTAIQGTPNHSTLRPKGHKNPRNTGPSDHNFESLISWEQKW